MADKRRKVRKTDQETLTPVQPNAGVESEYRRKMQALITSMQNSVVFFLTKAYRSVDPTEDLRVSGVRKIESALDELKKRWFPKFDEAAPKLAAGFVAKASQNIDLNMTRQLRDRKFGIHFELTPEMRAIVHTEIVQNVSLIQSIPSQYFTEVEGLVMRSVAVGGDLKTLTDELHKRYGITLDRAARIATDQNHKVNAVMSRVRQLEAGFTHAEWRHTASNHPRQSHIDFGGKIYEIAKGAYIDGEWIWPGQKIGCFPGDELVNIVQGCHEIWRYHYRGNLVSLKTGQTAIRSTPNHPLLTNNGWVGAQFIEAGDYVWQARNKNVQPGMTDVDQTKFAIEDVFSAFGVVAPTDTTRPSTVFNFHGDIPDTEVEAVRFERELFLEYDTRSDERVAEFDLTEADHTGLGIGSSGTKFVHVGGTCCGGNAPQRGNISICEPLDCGLGAVSGGDPAPRQPPCDERARDVKMLGDTEHAISLAKHVDDVLCREIVKVVLGSNSFAKHDSGYDLRGHSKMPGYFGDTVTIAVHADNGFDVDIDSSTGRTTLSGLDRVTLTAELLAELISTYAKMGCKSFEAGEIIFEAVRVDEKLVCEDFVGHVYTFQSNDGWFSAGAANIVTQNCKCMSLPIVPDYLR
jgi:hypothetical protein